MSDFEHVFDVRTSLTNLTRSLRVGGIAMHISPLGGFENHGFYQFGPKLFARFYAANGFRDLQAWAIHLTEDDNRAFIEPIEDHDAPFPSEHAAFRSLLLYSARLHMRTNFVTPIDTHLAACGVSRGLLLPTSSAMHEGLRRSGFARTADVGAHR